MRWWEKGKKTPNKRKQWITVSGGDDSQNSGVKTFHLPFDFLCRTCPMFRGSKATREEHLRSDWRIGARTLFRHKLGGEGCSSFIYIMLHLGSEVPPLLRFTRVLRIINARVNNGFPQFKLELLVCVSSKCRFSFSVWHYVLNADWEVKGKGKEG